MVYVFKNNLVSCKGTEFGKNKLIERVWEYCFAEFHTWLKMKNKSCDHKMYLFCSPLKPLHKVQCFLEKKGWSFVLQCSN